MNPSISKAAIDTWTGNSGTDDNWATAGNFSYSPSVGQTSPSSGDVLAFQGTSAPASSVNNETGLTNMGLEFLAGAQSYTISGNSFAIANSGTFTDASANAQTISSQLIANSVTATITAGSLALSGGLTDTSAGTVTFQNNLSSGSTVGLSINGITAAAIQAVTFTTPSNKPLDVLNVSLSGGISAAGGNQNFNFNQGGTVTASSIAETSGTTSWNFANSGNNSVSGTFTQTAGQKGAVFNFDGTGSSSVTTTMGGTVTVSTGFVAYAADGAETDTISANITTSGAGSTGGDVVMDFGIISTGTATPLGTVTPFTGSLTISGTNVFQGTGTSTPSAAFGAANTIAIRSGSLIIGSTDTDATHGALGGSSSKAAVTLGDTSGSSNASLLIGGAYTMATPFTVQAGNTGTITIGGNAANTSNITGNITVNKAVTLQAATGGTVVFKSGTWTINNSSAFTIGSTGNTGTVELDNGLTTAGGVSVAAGTLNLASTLNVTGSTLAVGTAGTLSSTSAGNVTGNATLTGSGIINLNSSSNISGTLGVTGGTWGGGGSVTGLVTSSSGAFTIGSGANLKANGDLSVTGGTIAASDSTGTVTGNVSYSSTASSIYQGVIAGSGKTLSVSAGSLTLSGTNTYTGATSVSGGKLYVNGSTGSGSVTVTSPGTLAGGGTVGGAVSVQAGGTLASGSSQTSNAYTNTGSGKVNGTGTGGGLTLSSTLIMAGGTTLSFALGSDVHGSGGFSVTNPNLDSTFLTVQGAGNIFADTTTADNIFLTDLTAGEPAGSSTLTLRYQGAYLLIAGSASNFTNLYTTGAGNTGNGYVLGVDNGLGGFTAFNIEMLNIGGTEIDSTTNYQGMRLYLNNGNLELVPEPGTWALMLGGLAVLVLWQRRRNV